MDNASEILAPGIPLNEFKAMLEKDNANPQPLETALTKLSRTKFGQRMMQHLAAEKRPVTKFGNNSNVINMTRLDLHPGVFHMASTRGAKDPQQIESSNPAARQQLLDSIGQNIYHHFAHSESLPNIYAVDWLGKDEVVVREEREYNPDEWKFESGDFKKFLESKYTVYKDNKPQGVIIFEEAMEASDISNRPLARISDGNFLIADSVEGLHKVADRTNVYVNPKSSYAKTH